MKLNGKILNFVWAEPKISYKLLDLVKSSQGIAKIAKNVTLISQYKPLLEILAKIKKISHGG